MPQEDLGDKWESLVLSLRNSEHGKHEHTNPTGGGREGGRVKPRTMLCAELPSANWTQSTIQTSFENLTCKYHNSESEIRFQDSTYCHVNILLMLQYLLFNIFDLSMTKTGFVSQRDVFQIISQYCDLEIVLNAAYVWYKIMMHCHLEPTILS